MFRKFNRLLLWYTFQARFGTDGFAIRNVPKFSLSYFIPFRPTACTVAFLFILVVIVMCDGLDNL